MATRAEIRKKLGIVTLEDPSVANKELSEKDALEYENFMKSLLDFNKEIDENIKSFCSGVNITEQKRLISVIP